MKKITLFITLFSFVFAMQHSVAQTYDLIASFNGTNYEDPFGGTSATYATDPVGTDQVLMITSNPGEVWQGINVNNLASNFRLTAATQLTMQLEVYSTTPITIAPKAQGGLTGAPESITTATHSGSSAWETLTFTFNQSLDGKAPANGVYADFALHINWNTGTNSFGTPDSRVFYIRNLRGLAEAVIDLTPTVAAPTPPARLAADVISLFSNAYTNIAIDNWSATWDSADISDVQIVGNDTKKINFGNFLGIQLGSYLDLSTFTHMHFDYWITDDLAPGQVFNPKLSNHATESGETSAIESNNPITTTGEWVSFEVELDNFTIAGGGSDVRNKIKEILLITAATFSEVYVDNFYFHKNTTLNVEGNTLNAFKSYPNPTKNAWTIKSDNGNITSINVFDILGKNVLALKPNTKQANINATNLKTGLYFAKIEGANGTSTLKLVKN